jgi:ethanolamine transporter EutH
MDRKLVVLVAGLITAAIYLAVVFLLFFTGDQTIASILGFGDSFDEGRKVVGTILGFAGLGALYLFFKSLLPKDDFWD